MRKVIAISAICLVFIGCKKENAIEAIPLGAFEYKAYDTTGTLVVDGWFKLSIHDSAHIDGEWHFTKVNDPRNIGPQSGDGQLEGGFDREMLWINLNPGYVDNNVFLSGRYTIEKYTGTWTWSGFPGVINQGTFAATNRSSY